MFPIRDHNPSGRTPYVTYALIAINIVVFLYSAGLEDRGLWQFYSDYAMFPERVSQGQDLQGLFTSMFLHGGFMHLAGNMLFLWIFGDNLEDDMGHLPFTLFYLAGGIGAGLAQVISEPSGSIPTVGASGAIAAVMGGYLLLYPKAKVDILMILIIFFRIFTIPAWVMLGLWFALQLVNGVNIDPETGGVAYWAHAGGFVIGFVLALPLWRRKGGTDYWNETHGHPPHPEAQYRLSRSNVPNVGRRSNTSVPRAGRRR
ncbi:rhomboid family intramembrane serine protease [Cognatishimia sp.]|uniref:rhomboid family intramembrane serine protease n=1 Tax=Cognatishimia sp. TaxID=2211648 RepID=UPI0035160902